MVLTLARNGSSYSTANKRYFEAWGAVAHSAGVQTRNPSQRYCANLGHVEDDESGLTYMRARYYEPGVGRFLSEDREMDGLNWYVYASSCPIEHTDPTGKWTYKRGMPGHFAAACLSLAFVLVVIGIAESAFKNKTGAIAAFTVATALVVGVMTGIDDFGTDATHVYLAAFAIATLDPTMLGILTVLGISAGESAKNAIAFVAASAITMGSIAVLGTLLATMVEDTRP